MIFMKIKNFWSLEGFVAIIFSIFAIKALLCGSYLWAILIGIFSYWWIQRVLAKPIRAKRRKNYCSHEKISKLNI
jgi:hypothetical protein